MVEVVAVDGSLVRQETYEHLPLFERIALLWDWVFWRRYVLGLDWW